MDGYQDLASVMSRYFGMGILRRFGTLSTLNLLYLQAELVHLESDLEAITSSDIEQGKAGDKRRGFFTQDWELLSKPLGNGDEKQWEKMLQIREKLKEYYTCLQHQLMLSKLDEPDKQDLETLRRSLEEQKPLLGLDADAWNSPTDLITVCRLHSKDPFSKFVVGTIIPFFHEMTGRHIKHQRTIPEAPSSRIIHYSDSRILKILDVIVTVVSSLLLISSIIVLYLISNPLTRLWVIAGFTVVFSLCLALMTETRRVEVFAASSAFAAVQVVFVSINSAGPVGT